MEPIDLTLALSATDGDVGLLQEVVDAFLEEYPALLAELEPAIQAGESSVVQRASHKIKGTLRLFGDVPPRELAERLEKMGATSSLEDAKATFESLKLSLNSLRHQVLEAMRDIATTSPE